MPSMVVQTGELFRDVFRPFGEFEPQHWTCISRMIREEEDKIYGGSEERFREIFDLQVAEELAKDFEDIDLEFLKRHMSFQHLGYKLQWVKKLMFPWYHEDSYNLIVVDHEEKHVYIMDPTDASTEYIELKEKHEEQAVKIVRNLRKCIHAIFDDWVVAGGTWNFKYNTDMHENCHRLDSPIYIVHYIREFTGQGLRYKLTESGLRFMRQSIALQVVSMEGNEGNLPDFYYNLII